ncbi:hypothetical protein BC828DRAFT_375142 [Blastocladiella britannica]|nr:hypothetical protein BC828DRAFT_375142 [Blastocladiella britannica]
MDHTRSKIEKKTLHKKMPTFIFLGRVFLTETIFFFVYSPLTLPFFYLNQAF